MVVSFSINGYDYQVALLPNVLKIYAVLATGKQYTATITSKFAQLYYGMSIQALYRLFEIRSPGMMIFAGPLAEHASPAESLSIHIIEGFNSVSLGKDILLV